MARLNVCKELTTLSVADEVSGRRSLRIGIQGESEVELE